MRTILIAILLMTCASTSYAAAGHNNIRNNNPSWGYGPPTAQQWRNYTDARRAWTRRSGNPSGGWDGTYSRDCGCYPNSD